MFLGSKNKKALQSTYYKDFQHMTVSGKTPGHNPKQWKKNIGAKETTCADYGVRGGNKPHDLNSRSIKKLNAEEEAHN